MTAIINVRRVSKAFGGVVANKDISMTVKPGTITGLIGTQWLGQDNLVQLHRRLSPDRRGIDPV